MERGRPSKYLKIAENIRNLIAEEKLKEGSALPSERQLAEQFGCTQVTIRRALKYLESIGAIHTIAHRGSFVGAESKFSDRGKSGLVALLFPDNELFYYQIFARLENFFASNGQHPVVHLTNNSPAKEKNILHYIQEHKFDGLVAVPSPACAALYRKLNMPTVFFDVSLDSLPIPSVVSDDFHGALQAVNHLIALGHRRIAMIGSNYEETGNLRLEGFIEALRRAGMNAQPEYIKLQQPTREWGYYAMQELFSPHAAAPTALFCANDTIAAGVIRYCHSHHISVPRDLSVVGFGNTEIAEDLGLASVEQNIEKIAESIQIKFLQSDAPANKTIIPCSLTLRSSTAKA